METLDVFRHFKHLANLECEVSQRGFPGYRYCWAFSYNVFLTLWFPSIWTACSHSRFCPWVTSQSGSQGLLETLHVPSSCFCLSLWTVPLVVKENLNIQINQVLYLFCILFEKLFLLMNVKLGYLTTSSVLVGFGMQCVEISFILSVECWAFYVEPLNILWLLSIAFSTYFYWFSMCVVGPLSPSLTREQISRLTIVLVATLASMVILTYNY